MNRLSRRFHFLSLSLLSVALFAILACSTAQDDSKRPTSNTTDPVPVTTDPTSTTTDLVPITTNSVTNITDPGSSTTDPGSSTTDPGSNTTDPVSITTDKASYSSGESVTIMITNKSKQSTYIYSGPCSFTLQSPDGSNWVDAPTSWSGCACGVLREIPAPVFFGPETSQTLIWDQIVISCGGGTATSAPASGRFRFGFRYAEDKSQCRAAADPFSCWLDYPGKKLQLIYSNEFNSR